MPVPSEAELVEKVERLLVLPGRVPPEHAGPFARTVLAYFRGREEVVDAKLASEDRGRFYALEDVGVLSCSEEEVHLGKGRRWRVHYWSFAPNGHRPP
ncbi:MAG: DUF6015 family protein [Thermoplasmata archaeon]